MLKLKTCSTSPGIVDCHALYLESKSSLMLLHPFFLENPDRLLCIVQKQLVQLIPVMVAGCRVLPGAGTNEDLLSNLTIMLCHVAEEAALLRRPTGKGIQKAPQKGIAVCPMLQLLMRPSTHLCPERGALSQDGLEDVRVVHGGVKRADASKGCTSKGEPLAVQGATPVVCYERHELVDDSVHVGANIATRPLGGIRPVSMGTLAGGEG